MTPPLRSTVAATRISRGCGCVGCTVNSWVIGRIPSSGSYNPSRTRTFATLNLQQLRYLCAVVDNGLNVSDAAEALYTSQPGISKQIRQLEDELGLRVFVRQGKRLTSLTPAGEVVVTTARRALREIANLKRVADEFRTRGRGRAGHRDDAHAGALRAAAGVVEVRGAFPKVRLVLHQGNPVQVAEQTLAGDVDVGIATEAVGESAQLVTLPCYRWNRGVLVPKGHPLASVRPLTLEAVAGYPIVTYDFTFTGRSAINAAFTAGARAQCRAVGAGRRRDQDVRRARHGRGHRRDRWRSMPRKDAGFEMLDASHLFAASTTRLALRKGVFLRGFVYEFITLFAPQYTRSAVDAALAGNVPVDVL